MNIFQHKQQAIVPSPKPIPEMSPSRVIRLSHHTEILSPVSNVKINGVRQHANKLQHARDHHRPQLASQKVQYRAFSSTPMMNIFDRPGKKRQRARAAIAPNWNEYDYLRSEVAKRLVDRIEDIMREFPLALELGAYGPHILKEIQAAKGLSGKGGVGSIETLVRCGQSEAGLAHPVERGEAEVIARDLIGDEEHLPFAPATFDLIISNMSLHWINDLPGAMGQACKALKPDGVFLASMLGGSSLKELRFALQLAEQEREGGISPHISPAAHVADCGQLLQAAGFALPTVDIDTVTVSYPDAITLMEHLQGMGESSAILTRRSHVSRETFLAAAAIYQELYGEPDGSIPATFQVCYMIGWAPSAVQPKPKARGSATVSLKTLDKRNKGEGSIGDHDDADEGGSKKPAAVGSGGCRHHGKV